MADHTLDLPAEDRVAAALTDAPGEMLGRFQITGRLGEGGMGVVLAARDPMLGRRVAIKVLRRANDQPMYRDRLLREARAMALLDHPNVVRIYEVGSDRDRVFVVMELVEGTTLAAWLRAEPRPWRDALAMFAQAAAGLAAIHRSGLVHRDFKPENVLVDHAGHVRVADLGLARLDSEFIEADASLQARLGTLTSTGIPLGTPRYMAPEQIAGLAVDGRADQYAFCVALREAATAAPPAVRSVLERGAARAPEDRYPSIDALLAAIWRAAGTPSRRRSIMAVSIAIAGVAAIAGALVVASSSSRSALELRTSGSANPVLVHATPADAASAIRESPPAGPAPDSLPSITIGAAVKPMPTATIPQPRAKPMALSERDQALRVAAIYDDAIGVYAIRNHLPLTNGPTALAAAHPTPFADLTNAVWPPQPFAADEPTSLDRHDIAPGHLAAVRTVTAALGLTGMRLTAASDDDVRDLHAQIDAASSDGERAGMLCAVGAIERIRGDRTTARVDLRAAESIVKQQGSMGQRADVALWNRIDFNLVLCDLDEGHGIDAAIYLAQHQLSSATKHEMYEHVFAVGIAEWETGLASGKDRVNRARADDVLRPIVMAYARAVRMIP